MIMSRLFRAFDRVPDLPSGERSALNLTYFFPRGPFELHLTTSTSVPSTINEPCWVRPHRFSPDI